MKKGQVVIGRHRLENGERNHCNHTHGGSILKIVNISSDEILVRILKCKNKDKIGERFWIRKSYVRAHPLIRSCKCN